MIKFDGDGQNENDCKNLEDEKKKNSKGFKNGCEKVPMKANVW